MTFTLQRAYDTRHVKNKPTVKFGQCLLFPVTFFDISSSIMVPDKKHLNRKDKLKYTVWTSDGYGNDGWHSYEGPPKKEFNSSYDTLEEANLRVAYVFYCKNPWGLGKNEMDEVDTESIRQQGIRFMQCEPPDSAIWTVSAVPSHAFDYINNNVSNKYDDGDDDDDEEEEGYVSQFCYETFHECRSSLLKYSTYLLMFLFA
jgi:hypothetical protein